MTQAFNLAQLANNLNTSGQLDATDGLSGLVANANLASSGTANSSSFLRGDRTWATLPAFGKILQVVQSTKTDTQTFSGLSNSWADISGLSVNITPSSTSSRIYLTGMLYLSSTGNPVQFRLVRNSTPILIGDAASNRKQVTSQPWGGGGPLDAFTSTASFVDSPSTTSTVTYKFQISIGGTATQHVNRTDRDQDATAEDGRSASSIIVMEIGA